MGCMLNFRKRNPRKQNETENFSIIRMDGGTLSRKIIHHNPYLGATYQYDSVVAKAKNGISEDVVNDWIEEERSKLKVGS